MGVKIKVKIKARGLRRKAQAVRREMPQEAERLLVALAEEMRSLAATNRADRRSYVERQIDKQLKAVFVPVELKYKRKELWPNLGTIYQARIVRGQSTYSGRKRFWVDEHKEEALREDLIRRALQKRSEDHYEIRIVTTHDRRYRVEIIRKGSGKGKTRIPPVMVSYARTHIRATAVSVLQSTFRRIRLAV